MNKTLGVTLLAFLIQGCSYQKTNVNNEIEKAKYDPQFNSRVRVFSSPEVTGRYKSFENCEQTHQIKNENGVYSWIGFGFMPDFDDTWSVGSTSIESDIDDGNEEDLLFPWNNFDEEWELPWDTI